MSIERSTELLRQALPWMSRQAAGLHPVSYAVWFEYVALSNPPLRAAIDEHLARAGSLDESATYTLYARHVADVDPEAAQRVVDGIQRVLGGVGDAVGSTGAQAARFGATLSQLAGALERGDTARGMGEDSTVARNGPPQRLLADVVAEVIADTGAMRTHLGGLQQRLADSRREVDRLREEVRRAREDALRDPLTGLANRRALDQALAACLLALEGGASPAASASAALAAIEAAKALSTGAPRLGERRAEQVPAAAVPAAPAGSPNPNPDTTPSADAAVPARGPWLLLADIDQFAHIVGTYGRAFGDDVLKAVADALPGLAPAGVTTARVDGEVFALLAPALDAGAALALAERVRGRIGSARIRRPGQADAERITLSLGLAAHRPGDTPASLVERAGEALLQAQRDGRDRVSTIA